jgi:4-diphosphocytidyl-2-C-methyl-D-erythritol kinase
VTGAGLGCRAPGKVNLCLFVGPPRDDGRHELVSVMQSVSLADRVVMRPAPAGMGDELVCEGVEGTNLALAALMAFRAATGWDEVPQRIEIDKRVPVAAGMGGGSADAAAVLRLAAQLAGVADRALLESIAFELGADVPSQVAPGRALVTGAGEHVEPLEDAPSLGVVVLPSPAQLSTGAVYAEADRLGLARSPADLEERLAEVRAALAVGAFPPRELVVNDLQAAAVSLEPSIDAALKAARGAGADVTLVSGSGPTVVGLFGGEDGTDRAQAATVALTRDSDAAIAARAVDAAFAAPAAA